MGFKEDLNNILVTGSFIGPLQCDGFSRGAKWAYDYAKQESGWQPIETAPKDGTEILTWTRDGTGYDKLSGILHWSEKHNTWALKGWGPVGCYTAGIYLPLPTHWIPLPSPPTGNLQRNGSSENGK